MDAPSDIPSRDDLRAHVAEVFAGSGWHPEACWIEWWANDARFCRVLLEPKRRKLRDQDGITAIERSYQLRKVMAKLTGVPWVVVIYRAPMTLEERDTLLGRMAGRFGH
jgi:hypothetical protein